MSSTAERILFNKDRYYEVVTRQVRWLAIVIVLATYPFDSPGDRRILFVVLFAAVYNLSRYLEPITNLPVLRNKASTIAVDSLAILSLLALTGGVHSFYYLFLAFMIMTAAYWYGLAGASLVLAVDAVATTSFALGLHWTYQPLSGWRAAAALIATLAGISYLGERLTQAERRQRSDVSQAGRLVDAERQRLLALINSLADAVIAVNDHSRVILYNGAALDLLNTNAVLSGKFIDTVLPLVTDKNTTISLSQLTLKDAGITKRDDLVYVAGEGNRVNIDLTISPIRSFSHDRPSEGYILVLRDVTRAKTLDQQRDEFVSVVSHELRTPLAIAEANISTALLPKFGPFKPETDELLHQAHKNVIFLAGLIKDLTTLAKAEQGSLVMDLKTVDPNQLLTDLADDYGVQAEDKGIRLTIHHYQPLPPLITSDYRVHEILQNLITNALRYTPKGSITLAVRPSPTNPSRIVFSVKDTGIGISSTDRKHIFEKFYRSEDYRTRQTGGTGLGLYIAHKLAAQLNGRIWFGSQLDHGSTFYFELGSMGKVLPAAEAMAF